MNSLQMMPNIMIRQHAAKQINNSNNQQYLLSIPVTQQIISDLIVRENDYDIVYDTSVDNLPTKQNNENDIDNYIIQTTCMESTSKDCDIDIAQEVY